MKTLVKVRDIYMSFYLIVSKQHSAIM